MAEQDNAILDVLEVKGRFILRENIDIEQRVIHLNTSVTSKSVDKLIRSITFLEGIHDDPITLIINSPGGDVYSAFALIDKIKSSRCEVRTVGTGLVASAAIPILASGKVRRATKNVSMMYHEPSFNLPFDRLTTAETETKHVKQLGQKLNRFMAEHTTKSYSFWSGTGKHVDFYFDADKALEYGLIEEVINGVFNASL